MAKNMKLAVFSYRNDETAYFDKFVEQYNADAVFTSEALTLESAEFAKGCDCISIITTKVDEKLLDKLKECRVKFISTRTIGYDHIDIEYAHKIGISVGNVSYSPNSVAEYTVMLILMANRKVKHILERSLGQDYSLKGKQGKELRNQTVGVIGTGKIGAAALDVIEDETNVFYNDFKYAPIKNRELAILMSFPNVTVMPHTAFYTDQAVSDMVENSILSCIENCGKIK